ncbi:MAG: MBL fold metallo-hydrolase [Deltaproteobacteria bacterium]|nr:MAG: MBL fold metallo-hydrolase [Deltaproteobacteria bacterium]
MIFKQLVEPVSSTYTYLLACEETGRAVLIDPVLPTWQRDVYLLQDLGLTLAFTVDTHIHADHLTSARKLKRELGSQIAHPAFDNLPCADHGIDEGTPLIVGSLRIDPLFTPGHTDGHHAYRLGDRVFTGDALLIDGCGRTDFQNGDAPTLYRSVHDKLFTLPEDTLVYPAHDYKDRRVSTIAQEMARNPRLGADRPLDEFVEIMAGLKLNYPTFIDYAVPGNRACGLCPEDLPEGLVRYCDQPLENRQG